MRLFSSEKKNKVLDLISYHMFTIIVIITIILQKFFSDYSFAFLSFISENFDDKIDCFKFVGQYQKKHTEKKT